MRRLFPLSLLIILLCGCATPAASSPTLPTVTATVAPPSTTTPTKTSTPTPVDFSSSLGLSTEFTDRLSGEGINSTLTKSENGWIANQVITGWDEDGTPKYEQNITVVSFSADASVIHNAGYPDGILAGVDNQGKTIFWSEEEKAWVKQIDLNNNDIENPVPYPTGKQYLVVESALLNPDLNQSLSDEAVKTYAGWNIQLQYDEATNTSYAFLRPTSADSIRWVLKKNGTPVWVTSKAANGIVYESVLVQLLNPANPAHPHANETMFILASAGEWWRSDTQVGGLRDLFNSWYIKGENQDEQPFWETLSPQIILAQRNSWFLSHSWGSFRARPSLDSLLEQPRNSLDELGDLGNNINIRIDQAVPSQKVIEFSISDYPELLKQLINIQNTIWPLSFTI